VSFIGADEVNRTHLIDSLINPYRKKQYDDLIRIGLTEFLRTQMRLMPIPPGEVFWDNSFRCVHFRFIEGETKIPAETDALLV
jgi:hypothetical protein